MTMLRVPLPFVQPKPYVRHLLDSIRIADAAQFLAAEADLDLNVFDVFTWTDRSPAQRATYSQRVETVLKLMNRAPGTFEIKPSHVALAMADRVREVVAVLLDPVHSVQRSQDQAVQLLLGAVSEAVALELEGRR